MASKDSPVSVATGRDIRGGPSTLIVVYPTRSPQAGD